MLAAVSDQKIPHNSSGTVDYYNAETTVATDYGSFGAILPGRNVNGGNYKMGFNGMEMDNEVKGTAASYDYGFRIYDPRVARFLSIDPLTKSYPWYTPYQFAGNSPIAHWDVDGLEKVYYMGVFAGNAGQSVIGIMRQTSTFNKAEKNFQNESQNIGMNLIVVDGYPVGKTNHRSEGNTVSIDNQTLSIVLESADPMCAFEEHLMNYESVKVEVTQQVLDAAIETSKQGRALLLNVVKIGTIMKDADRANNPNDMRKNVKATAPGTGETIMHEFFHALMRAVPSIFPAWVQKGVDQGHFWMYGARNGKDEITDKEGPGGGYSPAAENVPSTSKMGQFDKEMETATDGYKPQEAATRKEASQYNKSSNSGDK